MCIFVGCPQKCVYIFPQKCGYFPEKGFLNLHLPPFPFPIPLPPSPHQKVYKKYSFLLWIIK